MTEPIFTPAGNLSAPSIREWLKEHPGVYTVDEIAGAFNLAEVGGNSARLRLGMALAAMAKSRYSHVYRAGRGRYGYREIVAAMPEHSRSGSQRRVFDEVGEGKDGTPIIRLRGTSELFRALPIE